MSLVVCNDYVCGINGEEVLWNFLCDGIKGAIGVDSRTVKTKNTNPILNNLIKRHLDTLNPRPTHIIQNATFIGMVDPARFSIVYLQDDLRKMGRGNQPNGQQQSKNLQQAKIRVCNSRITARSYPEYNFEIIPIGVNDKLFSPPSIPKETHRIRTVPESAGYSKIGIFVGALDNIKGWPAIDKIIHNRSDIFFIVVSKYPDGKCTAPNSVTFNQITQQRLSELLGCADFFILGSPVETQCLAAIEACLCGVPVIMKETGIFMDFSDGDRNECGVFGNDLSGGINKVISNADKFKPREVMIRNDLSIEGMLSKWRKLLTSVGYTC